MCSISYYANVFEFRMLTFHKQFNIESYLTAPFIKYYIIHVANNDIAFWESGLIQKVVEIVRDKKMEKLKEQKKRVFPFKKKLFDQRYVVRCEKSSSVTRECAVRIRAYLTRTCVRVRGTHVGADRRIDGDRDSSDVRYTMRRGRDRDRVCCFCHLCSPDRTAIKTFAQIA